MNKIVLLAFLISCFLAFCAKADGLRLEFYSKGKELIYTIEEKDIICFDWEHQSVLVTDKIKKDLIENPILLGGIMMVRLHDKVLYEVDIISDNMTYEFGKPKLIFENRGLFFFQSNWFFIRYLKNNYELQEGEKPYFEELLNDSLFLYLKKKGKLNCKNWQYSDSLLDLNNTLDLNPKKTAEQFFNSRNR